MAHLKVLGKGKFSWGLSILPWSGLFGRNSSFLATVLSWEHWRSGKYCTRRCQAAKSLETMLERPEKLVLDKRKSGKGLLSYFRWRNLGQSRVWTRASPLLSGHHGPAVDGIGSQGAGAEVLKVRSKLFPFLLSLLSPLSVTAPLPERAAVLSQRVWSRCPVGLGCVLGPSLQISRVSDALNPLPPPAPVMATFALF